MMAARPRRALTLAIHPSSRGFGWIAMEGPFTPWDWGIVNARGKDKNGTCIRRIEKLFTHLEPQTLVLEEPPQRISTRVQRVVKLQRGIIALAASRSIEVMTYTFDDVRHYYRGVGARTRQEIAKSLAQQVTALAHLLPRKRRPWESENPRLALFSAGALAQANYSAQAALVMRALSARGEPENS